jgi:hypothetical protein
MTSRILKIPAIIEAVAEAVAEAAAEVEAEAEVVVVANIINKIEAKVRTGSKAIRIIKINEDLEPIATPVLRMTTY